MSQKQAASKRARRAIKSDDDDADEFMNQFAFLLEAKPKGETLVKTPNSKKSDDQEKPGEVQPSQDTKKQLDSETTQRRSARKRPPVDIGDKPNAKQAASPKPTRKSPRKAKDVIPESDDEAIEVTPPKTRTTRSNAASRDSSASPVEPLSKKAKETPTKTKPSLSATAKQPVRISPRTRKSGRRMIEIDDDEAIEVEPSAKRSTRKPVEPSEPAFVAESEDEDVAEVATSENMKTSPKTKQLDALDNDGDTDAESDNDENVDSSQIDLTGFVSARTTNADFKPSMSQDDIRLDAELFPANQFGAPTIVKSSLVVPVDKPAAKKPSSNSVVNFKRFVRKKH